MTSRLYQTSCYRSTSKQPTEANRNILYHDQTNGLCQPVARAADKFSHPVIPRKVPIFTYKFSTSSGRLFFSSVDSNGLVHEVRKQKIKKEKNERGRGREQPRMLNKSEKSAYPTAGCSSCPFRVRATVTNCWRY